MPRELFGDIIEERPGSQKGFAASLAIHVVIVSLMLLWPFIGPIPTLPSTPKKYELQIIRYHLPEPLLFASASSREASGKPAPSSMGKARSAKPGRLQAARRQPNRAAAAPPNPAASEPPPAAALPAAPKVALQVPQRRPVEHRQVLIQPAIKPDILVSGKVDLPNLFLWSQPVVRPPVRKLETFVPGELKRTPRPRAPLDAPPKLEIPNQEIRVTDLKIGSIPEPIPRPKLPVYAATTSPVRRTQPQPLEAPSELPIVALPPGDPVSLLAMVERPAPPNAAYNVEAGNRFPPPSGGAERGAGEEIAAGSGASGPPGKGHAAESTSASSGAARGWVGLGNSGKNGAGAGSGSKHDDGPGSGPGKFAGVEVASGTGSSRVAGTGAGASKSIKGNGSGSGPASAGADVAGIRLSAGSSVRTETPNTSAFDVVVVNQNTRETFPESQGILTGQPVYTVYMTVPGSRQEWVLQYTIPHSREPIEQRGANSIHLGAATPVRAPYPLRKASLQPAATNGLTGRVVVYGAISEKGSLEALRIVRGVRLDVDSAVLACLHQFLFRPAVRDGVPVLVEALFGVPLN